MWPHIPADFPYSHSTCPVPPGSTQRANTASENIKPCSGSSFCPCLSPACQCCSQLTLLPKIHTSDSQAQLCHAWPGWMHHHTLCRVCSSPLAAALTLSLQPFSPYPLYFLLYNNDFINSFDLQRRAERDACEKSKTLYLPSAQTVLLLSANPAWYAVLQPGK